MKRFVLTLSIFGLLSAMVYAGPEPIAYSGKEMKQVAPMPPACPSWTGFYIGGFGGYKFSNIDLDLDLDGDWDTSFPTGRDAIEDHQPGNLDNDGAEAGGLIGYNFQWKNWVFGLEAAGGYLWARDSEVSGLFVVDDSDVYNLSNSFKTNYLVTVAPRIGYAFCRWLPYITGGVAIGDLDYDWGVVNVGSRDDGLIFHDLGHEKETNVGWMVGGGLEYAITSHWRVRGQYQYIDLGSVEFNEPGFGTPGFDLEDFTSRHRADLTEHNASFAIIYGF